MPYARRYTTLWNIYVRKQAANWVEFMNWRSTNRPGFAAANQVVTMRATSECVLTHCRSVQFICCEQAFMFIPSHSVSCEAWCCFAVLSQVLYRLFNICSTLEALSKALVIICYVFLIPSHSTPWVKKKQDTKLLAITSLNINRFSKFFQ